jgi:PAS domain S-box-containing protein
VLLAFVGALVGFLVLMDAVAIMQQRAQLRNEVLQQAVRELDLMETGIIEFLLKRDYISVQLFLERWGEQHMDILRLKAISSNGFVLAEYDATGNDGGQGGGERFTMSKDVEYAGQRLVSIELVGDYSSIQGILHDLTLTLLAGSMVFMGVLGVTLWWLLGAMAIKPLEREIALRREAERALEEHRDKLEQMVDERTRELVESEQQVRLLLNSTSEAIYGVDTHGACTFCNPACLRMLGFEREEALLGRNIHDIIHHTTADGLPHPAEECVIFQAFRRDEPTHDDMDVFWRADGTSFQVEYWSHPIKSSGAVTGAVVSFLDITERVQREREIKLLNEGLERRVAERTADLEASNRELEAFSYSVSHDLRAPLRSIDGFSQALIEDFGEGLPAEAHEYLRRVRSGSQRMARLIDDMLRLSRITRVGMSRTQVDISAMARSVADDLRKAHPDRIVDVEVQDGLVAEVDLVLFHSVIENLMGNAWKFTSGLSEGARIEVGRTEHEGRACFYVRDNGAGFDMAYSDKLFGAFQRLHSATEFEGSGVGLATAQRIVRRHGGLIWAEGAVGQGATFYFTVG